MSARRGRGSIRHSDCHSDEDGGLNPTFVWLKWIKKLDCTISAIVSSSIKLTQRPSRNGEQESIVLLLLIPVFLVLSRRALVTCYQTCSLLSCGYPMPWSCCTTLRITCSQSTFWMQRSPCLLAAGSPCWEPRRRSWLYWRRLSCTHSNKLSTISPR